ncbi:MAG: ImmA/IrrE family metallo-endopeptidase [Ignavibacterium sp.]|nr:ImmA/IrrE family metallo-endopeptidase [Ignavibacterium sp.]
MRWGFKTWAEKKAVEFRKDLSLKYYEKLPAELLANHLGVGLITPKDIPALTIKEKNLLLNHDSSSWSAISIKNNSGEYVIIFNSSHSKKRSESNLMHELGHIICKHDMEKIKLREDFPFPLRDYNSIQEDEANWLGGCLQIPRKALLWGCYKGMNKIELSDHFGASMVMISYRLKITGVERQINR